MEVQLDDCRQGCPSPCGRQPARSPPPPWCLAAPRSCQPPGNIQHPTKRLGIHRIRNPNRRQPSDQNVDRPRRHRCRRRLGRVAQLHRDEPAAARPRLRSCRPGPELTPPAKQLVRMKAMPPRNRRNAGLRFEALRGDPALLLLRPPALWVISWARRYHHPLSEAVFFASRNSRASLSAASRWGRLRPRQVIMSLTSRPQPRQRPESKSSSHW